MRWSHVCLLSTRNVVFTKLLKQMIKLRAQYPNYHIKTIRLDNADEYTSQTFIDYCMLVGINVEYSIAHTHTQNGLAKSSSSLQLIARPLLLKTKLPTSTWGHVIMHVASLNHIQPTTYHKYSRSQLVLDKQQNISRLQIFGCALYVPITPTQCTKISYQQRLKIYVGFDSPSIIRYLEPLTKYVFTARFAYCHFNERVFPPLRGERYVKKEQ